MINCPPHNNPAGLERERTRSRLSKPNFYNSNREDEDELLIDFSEKPLDRRKNRESKGYINKGWSYAVRNKRTSPEI
jgi:hypothetical protein